MAQFQLTFIEQVNPHYCDILAKISYTQFTTFYNTESENDETGESVKPYTQYNMLHKYCSNMIANNYKLCTTYKYSNNKTDGRIFVDSFLGLQRIWNKFRGVLCDGLNVDIDMVNAHPCILQYICRENNIICVCLNNYIANRAQLLSAIMTECKITKEEAKILFITSLNKDTEVQLINKKLKIKNTFFLAFDVEIKTIQKRLCELHPALVKEITKKGKNNVGGRLTNQLMCTLENEILQLAIQEAKNTGIVVNVPMFDGFMCDSASMGIMPIPIFINNLNTITTEYGIKWSHKEHNTEIADVLDAMVMDYNIHTYLGKDEVEVALYCISHILEKKIYICNGEVLIYNNLVWSNKGVKAILMPIISKHDLWVETKKEDKPANKTRRDLENLVELIITHAPNNPRFYDKMNTDTLQKLCYQNGYYDFKLGRLVAYTKDNIPYTKFIINRNYVVDTTCVHQVYTDVIYPIFDVKYDTDHNVLKDDNYKNMQYTLNSMSRKLAGHIIEDKDWLIMLGDRNSGKGVLQEAFIQTFEKYIGMFNTSVLLTKPTGCGEDSKLNAWMLDFEFTRIMFGSEIQIGLDTKGKHTTKLNGVLLKSLTGGDKLKARSNNVDAREFNIQSSIILTANDIPTCEPADALENLKVFHMPCRFMSDDEYAALSNVVKPTVNRKVKKPQLKAWLRTEAAINSFQYIILEAYKWNVAMPVSLKPKPEEDETELDKFYALFIFTGLETDFVSNKDIRTVLEENAISYSLIKANKYLVAMGCKKGYVGNERGLTSLRLI